jgi:uncharacterized protein YdeI (YjbR/CyaY-like superfamily)
LAGRVPVVGHVPVVDEFRSGLPVVAFATASEFEAWLACQPMGSPGLWLKLAKKGAGAQSVAKQDAIEAATRLAGST